jgi:hypothetical protein
MDNLKQIRQIIFNLYLFGFKLVSNYVNIKATGS